MGAQIETTDGHLPLTITGGAARGDRLRAAGRERPGEVGDPARRRSAPRGRTTVVEPAPTRDHTELMLQDAGVRVSIRPSSVSVDPPERLRLGSVDVPGDFSSAAPFIVAATLIPESRITIHDVSLNPRRTGLARRARADGRPRRDPPAPPDRRRAGRRPRGARRRADRDDDPLERGAAPRRRAAARSRCSRRSRAARAGSTAPASCGTRRPTGSRRSSTRCARSAGASRRTTKASRSTGVPARPKGGKVDARGDHRIAMLGAVAGLVEPRGRRGAGRRHGGDILPRLLRPPTVAGRLTIRLALPFVQGR